MTRNHVTDSSVTTRPQPGSATYIRVNTRELCLPLGTIDFADNDQTATQFYVRDGDGTVFAQVTDRGTGTGRFEMVNVHTPWYPACADTWREVVAALFGERATLHLAGERRTA